MIYCKEQNLFTFHIYFIGISQGCRICYNTNKVLIFNFQLVMIMELG
jgi:hypothetical protein